VTGNSHPEDLFRKSVRSLKRNKVGLKGERIYSVF
jgi:isocitrate dehydrogenase (NAD+)